jgi:hypothetical protein
VSTPIHGLYPSFAGPVASSLSASTKRMVIAATSAAALAAGSAVENLGAGGPTRRAVSPDFSSPGRRWSRPGLLRLGRFTCVVSHSVLIALRSGVAIEIVAGHMPDLTGAVARLHRPRSGRPRLGPLPGQPVGGSVEQTALNRAGGASRAGVDLLGSVHDVDSGGVLRVVGAVALATLAATFVATARLAADRLAPPARPMYQRCTTPPVNNREQRGTAGT